MATSLLNNEIKSLLEKALASELYVSNLYKHIANQLQRLGYFGAQSYFLKESADELSHYQKLSDYCNDMGWVARTCRTKNVRQNIQHFRCLRNKL